MDVKIEKNVLFSRSFHFGNVLGGLNILPHISIKMTKMEKMIILTQHLDPFKNSKFILKHILKALFRVISKMILQLNCHAEIVKKLSVEADVKLVTNVLFSRSFHFGSVVGGLSLD